ncbi:hypothetical protein BV25DRAFT_1839019 [Artomyces pyxidatus]|uniref:Uncharacterized protein n=1 Tax=Artomyces pyxidatus TaxID=48021 RepID=A0ACB8T0F9_9AGAM|nr:hypothetical protein BV25DRAFT_1839019 [Artomyces pyxidatus]
MCTKWHRRSRELGWIRVTHVCRRWRAVALSNATLWNELYIDLGWEWVAEMAHRSSMTPLTILHPHTDVPPHLSQVIPIHSDRIHHLDIRIGGSAAPAVIHAVQHSMPNLRSLELHCSPIPLQFLASPCLRALHLDQVPFLWEAIPTAFLEALRTSSSVGRQTPTVPEAAGDTFVAFLQSATRLHHLSLRPVPHWPADGPPIRLPALWYLSLNDTGSNVNSFLEAVETLDAASVRVQGAYRTLEEAQHTYTLLTNLCLQRNGERAQWMATLEVAAAERYGRELDILASICPESTDDTNPAERLVHLTVAWRTSTRPRDVAPLSARLISSAVYVRRLKWVGDLPPPPAPPLAFPALEDLTIGSNHRDERHLIRWINRLPDVQALPRLRRLRITRWPALDRIADHWYRRGVDVTPLATLSHALVGRQGAIETLELDQRQDRLGTIMRAVCEVMAAPPPALAAAVAAFGAHLLANPPDSSQGQMPPWHYAIDLPPALHALLEPVEREVGGYPAMAVWLWAAALQKVGHVKWPSRRA